MRQNTKNRTFLTLHSLFLTGGSIID